MTILVNKDTRLVVQGITGREGEFHTRQMLEYGTNIVAGMTPGKGDITVAGVPVFNTMREAVGATGANASIIYVPAAGSADAVLEAADAGIKLIVCITEGVPTLDELRIYHRVKQLGARLIGPNCPGLISPGECKVGIMPGHIHKKGPVGLVSRSGTLTYEVVWELTQRGIGQTTCVGIGGDPLIGTNFVDCLTLFQADPETKAIVMLGEIGGTDEEDAAAYIKAHVTKPVVSFIAGQSAPEGKRMGHAGAIISGGKGTAADKVAALTAAGVSVSKTPAGCAEAIQKLL